MTLVSVVVPTYNRAALVIDALESVLGQTHRPLELVVVDDGSTDDSVHKIQSWFARHQAPEFICRLLTQENSGGNVARNAGITAATGGYVAFLDSDDLWRPTKLAEQLSVAQTREGVGAVYCGLVETDVTAQEVLGSSRRSYPQGRLLSSLLVRDETAPTSCYLVRRSVFEEVGLFDTTLAARQDWDMWIRIATKFEIMAVPRDLVVYRHHPGERTATNPEKEIAAYRRIRAKYVALLDRLPWQVRRQAASAYHKRMGRVHFHHGLSTRHALLHYLVAIGLYPVDIDAWAACAGVVLPGKLRRLLHRKWNIALGSTRFAVRSH